jgi:hypothetical protein
VDHRSTLAAYGFGQAIDRRGDLLHPANRVQAVMRVPDIADDQCRFLGGPLCGLKDPVMVPCVLGYRLLDLQDQRKNFGIRWALAKAAEAQCKPSKKT